MPHSRKKKTYVVMLRLSDGQFVATRWTNKSPLDATIPPEPVSCPEAVEALHRAQQHWPDEVYKIERV